MIYVRELHLKEVCKCCIANVGFPRPDEQESPLEIVGFLRRGLKWFLRIRYFQSCLERKHGTRVEKVHTVHDLWVELVEGVKMLRIE